MMRIALVLTGGTIGSALRDGYISPAENAALAGYLPDDFEVKIFRPFTTLSEQLDGKILTRLIKHTETLLSGGYDGIIVAHGTDTLQFSAAALSLAFENCGTPIVLASANYILSDRRSNGADNLYFAAEFIREKTGGVFASYRNTGEKPEIHLGSRLLAHPAYSDRLSSLGGAFGVFDDGFHKLSSKPETESVGAFELSENSPVLWLKAHPGMIFPDVHGCKAVLLEGYHSGTLPTESESFRRFCKDAGCPVYLAGMTSGTQYESTSAYRKLGIIPLVDQPPIYAYMKLWVVYGSDKNHNIL